MQVGLEGKTTVVTEVERNHGSATALAFAREGANLLLAASGRGDLLEHTAHEASALGVRVVTSLCDIGDEGQVRAFAEKGIAELGTLDILVNNALFPLTAHPFAEIPLELWKRKIHLEVTGPFFMCKAVLPGMVQRRWGRIINFSGLAAFQGTDAPASTAELGIVGLTRGIAREYGRYNITANCIGPGGIEAAEDPDILSYPPNDGDPLPRWGKPEEIAFLAVCLAGEDAGYVTGQCLLANGGKYFI